MPFPAKCALIAIAAAVALTLTIVVTSTADRETVSAPPQNASEPAIADVPSGLGTPGLVTVEDAELKQQIAELSRRPAGELLALDIDDLMLTKALAAQLRGARPLPGSTPPWELAAHFVNVVPDELYPEVEAMILREDLEPSALDVLVGDAHQRDDALKLPLFARIAADPQHPAFQEAFAVLQNSFDDHDRGGLAQWRAAALRGPE